MGSIYQSELSSMVLCFDFDGVIHDQNPQPGYRMGRPVTGCLESMRLLKERGDTILIHTARIMDECDIKHVKDWLVYFGVPFDDICIYKPMADLYIDDKGVTFTSWQDLLTLPILGK